MPVSLHTSFMAGTATHTSAGPCITDTSVKDDRVEPVEPIEWPEDPLVPSGYLFGFPGVSALVNPLFPVLLCQCEEDASESPNEHCPGDLRVQGVHVPNAKDAVHDRRGEVLDSCKMKGVSECGGTVEIAT